MRGLFAAVTAAMVAVSSVRADSLPEGNWLLSYAFTPATTVSVFLMKVEKKDGKLTATKIDAPAKSQFELDSLTEKDGKVTIQLAIGTRKLKFEGTYSAKSPEIIRGWFGDEALVSRGTLSANKGDTIVRPDPANLPKPGEAFQKAQKLLSEVAGVRSKLLAAKEVEDRQTLTQKLKELQAEADKTVPGLYRETIEKDGKSIFAVESATQLLRSTARTKSSSQEVTAWVKIVMEEAGQYGPVLAGKVASDTADLLASNKDYADQVIGLLVPVADRFKGTESPAIQSRIYKHLAGAYTTAGKADQAKGFQEKFAKIEAKMDQDYMEKVPPFKPTPFGGRKIKAANRTVVMELFTGAQCPPCVAADVAFDALEKAYKPTELILLQYHMHIPGPDPLTNADSEARFRYYGQLNAGQVRGTPTTLFNGKIAAGGGGGMAASENKYNQYLQVINPILEESSPIKVTGSAKQTGDVIKIETTVDGIADPSAGNKLRFVLVEESIKYTGSNGLRFHHRVVRDMPGGTEGFAIKEKSLTQSAEVNLSSLRKKLTMYLDEASKTRTFPNSDRPVDLKHLSVIALVQEDDKGMILQAAEFPVK